MSDEKKDFHTRMLEFIEEKEKDLREQKANWWQCTDVLSEVIAALEETGAEAAPVVSDYVVIRVVGGKKELVAAVRALRTHGFSTTEKPPPARTSTWSAQYTKGALPFRLYLHFSSRLCNYVCKQEAIYVLECGEDENPMLEDEVETVEEATEDDIPL